MRAEKVGSGCPDTDTVTLAPAFVSMFLYRLDGLIQNFKLVAVQGICPGNIPWEYSLGIFPGNIPRDYSQGIFPGNIPREMNEWGGKRSSMEESDA